MGSSWRVRDYPFVTGYFVQDVGLHLHPIIEFLLTQSLVVFPPQYMYICDICDELWFCMIYVKVLKILGQILTLQACYLANPD